MSVLTAADIDRIQPGVLVSVTYDVDIGMLPKPGARWSAPAKVTEVFGRGTDVCGKQYVCFYRQFGETSQMSNSISEGQGHVRIVEVA